MPLALPLITFVPIKQIVSKSDMLSISSSCIWEFICFFTASDSPVKDDWLTYKSFASIILKSAGIILPADKITVSPITISFIGIFISFPFLITEHVVATNAFNFSADLLDL